MSSSSFERRRPPATLHGVVFDIFGSRAPSKGSSPTSPAVVPAAARCDAHGSGTRLWRQDSSALTPALARDSCHNFRPVFLEPSQSIRPVDDTLERFPGWVLEGFWLKPLRRILNQVVQAFVSASTLERLRNRRTGPPSPGQIDNARSVGLAEPGCGIELKTDEIISGMASSVDHWVSPFVGADRVETSFQPNILVPSPGPPSDFRIPFRCRAPISP